MMTLLLISPGILLIVGTVQYLGMKEAIIPSNKNNNKNILPRIIIPNNDSAESSAP